MTRALSRRRAGEALPRAEKIGDLMTADHKVLNEEGESRDKHRWQKTPHERWFGEPFKGPIIPFGAMDEYRPISPRDQSRLHQFGKKVLPEICQLIVGRNLERRYSDCGFGRCGKVDASEIYP